MLNLPLRSLKYPNLVFILIVERPNSLRPRQATDLPNPNVVTMDDIKELKGMAAAGVLASLGGIKATYGPKAAAMAGQAGRVLGREYHHKGYLEEGGPGAAYEFEAEVMG